MIETLTADPLFFASFASALVFTGAAAGVLAGLLDVGGGIVIGPVLFFAVCPPRG